MALPMPMRSSPPRISARFPATTPSTCPSMTPTVTIKKVVKPIAAAMGKMLTSRNAKPTPTAIASMLVAKPVTTSSQKECRLGLSAKKRQHYSPDVELARQLRLQLELRPVPAHAVAAKCSAAGASMTEVGNAPQSSCRQSAVHN